MTGTPFLLFLPEVALEKIFSFLTYDEIAKNRIVCNKFNEIGSKMLSRGFIQLEKRHVAIYKRVKSMLPRRESERRAHPLARHSEILQGVETRLSMMNMTYSKYIDSNLLCFIPGKVLDEMRNVLRIVETEQTPSRAHQLLQELRDLSSMAMEHFDEHILPRIKEQIERRTAFNYTTADSLLKKSPRLLYAHNYSLSNEVYKVKKLSKAHKHNITYLAQSTQKLCTKLRRQNLRLKVQYRKLKEQERKIQEQNTKIQEQETTLADIKKHIDEWDQKYTDLTTELVRARDEILAAASQRPSTSTSSVQVSPPASCSKIFRTNIKPRMANILPKGFHLHLDLERKRKSNLLPEIPLKRNRIPTEKPECPVNEFDHQFKDKWKKIKLPDLIDMMPNEPRCSDGCGKSDNVKSEVATKPSTSVKFSTIDIGSVISSSLENFLKNTPLSQISSRKRKMSEDIDLK